jgi:hypothetical protein
MLEKIKLLLGFAPDDTGPDAKLNLIISLTTSRLKHLLGGIDPPAELDYIITEVAIIRFNRIGSEGLTSHTVEGESQSFSDDDFKSYTADIQDWLYSHNGSAKGKVRFI